MVELEDMIEAYRLCLRHKRQTTSCMEYRLNWMERLHHLTESINSRRYYPSTSICFVVTRPRLREIFAANFEDRIVHHYIALRLEPLLEEMFNPRTFNCRKHRGQLSGVERLRQDMYELSEGYTRDCWFMKLDLKGFFMSIDKRLLSDKVDAFIVERYEGADKDDLRWLCRVVILHRPQLDCIRKSPDCLFALLPDHKTAFRNDPDHGIAIGNLFAQIFANFLLSDLDWFIERTLSIIYHGRYVDDIYMGHTDKKVLLSAVPRIRHELELLGLQLNERKFYLQHYSKGIRFTGAFVLPGRSYTLNRTVGNFVSAVHRLIAARSLQQIREAVPSVNSYLGMLRHYNEYALRRKWLSTIPDRLFKYIYIKGHYDVVSIRKRYRLPRNRISGYPSLSEV